MLRQLITVSQNRISYIKNLQPPLWDRVGAMQEKKIKIQVYILEMGG